MIRLSPRNAVRVPLVLACACTWLVAGCGSDSPTAPSAPGAPGAAVTGTVINALSNLPIAGVRIVLEGVGETTSAADGSFSLQTADAQLVRRVTLRSSSTIERVTGIRGSGGPATVSLMPSTVNLPAFNEMARADSGATHRWTSPPRLVVQRRVLTFTSLSTEQYVATATLLSDQEVVDLIADLTGALPAVSGGVHSAFSEVTIETAAEGEIVGVSVPRTVHAARYDGLKAGSTFSGYARWSWNGLGELFRAIVMLDQAFEQSAGLASRRALRVHELGHAYGYNHVTLRSSFMHASGAVEVNTADRDVARLVFLRPPMNTAPDTDPAIYSTNRVATGPERWSGAP